MSIEELTNKDTDHRAKDHKIAEAMYTTAHNLLFFHLYAHTSIGSNTLGITDVDEVVINSKNWI